MADHLKKFDFSGYQPAFDDADDLGKAEEAERPRNPKYIQAWDMIDYWVGKATGRYWPHLDKKKVKDGLSIRVTNPDLINQNATSLCGVATFVRELAHDDPVQYALLGALLYEGGWGNLGRKGLTRIQPSETTRMEKVPVNSQGVEMDHADWLVLASVRDQFNAFDYRNDVFEGLRGMTVDSMPQFFRAAGYDQLAYDYSGTSTRGIGSIEKANDLFRKGYAVAIIIHSSIMTETTRIAPHANHWVGLRSQIFVNRVWKPGQVGVRVDKIFSWGDGERSIPKDGNGFVPLQMFIDHYYGYVAAKAHVNGK